MAYRPKIKKSDGTLEDLPIEAEQSVKLKTARTIGLSGVTSTPQSFDGTGNVTIPITEVPADIVTGLHAVATSGSYNDLTNKPTISSFSMSRGTYTLDTRYNIPATGIYLCFLKFTNSAGYTSVACLGTMSNKPSVDNGSYSGISSIYYDGGKKNVQITCEQVSSTALKYTLLISTSATSMPSKSFDGDGDFSLIMFKCGSLSAIS